MDIVVIATFYNKDNVLQTPDEIMMRNLKMSYNFVRLCDMWVLTIKKFASFSVSDE